MVVDTGKASAALQLRSFLRSGEHERSLASVVTRALKSDEVVVRVEAPPRH